MKTIALISGGLDSTSKGVASRLRGRLKMKAIVLVSGGLDSTLAAKLIKEQGIEVIGLRFKIPFCLEAREYLPSLGIEIKEINIADEFLEIVKTPKYGYGSNANPCIDCKILMLHRAKEFMEGIGARFIITGEVLGQRPMSQNRQVLELIEKESGLQDILLRPLSAKLLPPTLPEREGWVQREKLLSFSGRGRRPQIELAAVLDIKEYTQPAGGCLLTDPVFAKRLKDILSHGELNLDNVELLKIGRHFRISPDAKLIVGRDEKENERLVNLVRQNDYLFYPNEDLAGPTSLGRGKFSEGLINLSCRITCRYCDLNGRTDAKIICRRILDKEDSVLVVSPIKDTKLASLRV